MHSRNHKIGLRLLVVAVLAVLVAFCAAVVQAAVLSGSPQRISGPSPFSGCKIGGPGTNYPNAEVEPWIAANPKNSKNLIGVWQQDRWNNGGAHGLVAAYSTNGGKSWKESYAPFSRCSGGTKKNGGFYQRASDPWVSFSPNGTAYQISISFDQTDPASSVLVSRSTNGGRSWSKPKTLIRDDSQSVFNDKESITADPNNSRYAYAVWDRIKSLGKSGKSKAASLSRNGARPENTLRPQQSNFRQPVYFSRTTNGGKSWSRARPIYDPGTNNSTIGNQIVVTPKGTLYDFFTLTKGNSVFLAAIRSTNHGKSWSKRPIIIARQTFRGAYDPDTGKPIRAEGGLPDGAVNQNSGKLYVVWQDDRFSRGKKKYDSIAYSESNDGKHWTKPIRINKTPISRNPANRQGFLGSVDVARDGTVAATYYDFRNNTKAKGVPTNYWFVRCKPGKAHTCAKARKWRHEVRLTPRSFDIEQAPVARGRFGYFVGDYEGLTHARGTFLPLFIQVNNGKPQNRTDAFFSKVGFRK